MDALDELVARYTPERPLAPPISDEDRSYEEIALEARIAASSKQSGYAEHNTRVLRDLRRLLKAAAGVPVFDSFCLVVRRILLASIEAGNSPYSINKRDAIYLTAHSPLWGSHWAAMRPHAVDLGHTKWNTFRGSEKRFSDVTLFGAGGFGTEKFTGGAERWPLCGQDVTEDLRRAARSVPPVSSIKLAEGRAGASAAIRRRKALALDIGRQKAAATRKSRMNAARNARRRAKAKRVHVINVSRPAEQGRPMIAT